MDVELIKDWQSEYDKWIPSQVFIANNEINDTTRELEKILDNVCMAYNEVSKNEWIATFSPNKKVCSQVNGCCADCALRYSCPASPDYAADDDDLLDDEDIDFEPRFVDDDMFEDDDLAF